ncbi:Phage major coat protein, Gp8 [compost metagenome]
MLKQIQAKLLFAFFALLGLVNSAMAAVGDDPGVDAINELSSKATLYIGAAFAVAVLVAGGFWGIKMMKKSFSKAG